MATALRLHTMVPAGLRTESCPACAGPGKLRFRGVQRVGTVL